MKFVMTAAQFKTAIKGISTTAGKLRDQVHLALIAAAYFAFKDGNTTPFNQIIASCGNAAHIKGITMWIELVSGIGRVEDEVIVLNKKVREQSGVIDEASFQQFADEMDKVKWYEVAGEQKPESVFDEGEYMKRVTKKLTKEGYSDLAEALKQTELKWLIARRKAEAAALEQAGQPAGE